MKNIKLVIFMPSIEGGGVEKNLFLISNYLANKLTNIKLITANYDYKSRFNKKIEILGPKVDFLINKGRKIKYIVCLYYLLITYLKNRNISVLAFQANMYAIIFCKIFGIKIITRSNSSPSGWSKNKIKIFLFKKILNWADTIIVNSIEFKKEMKLKFNTNTQCIYNPLNKQEIIKLSNKFININFFKKKKDLKIINIGRYVDQKDQITLLKALNLIKNKINFKAIIIGKGIHQNKLEKYIVENNLTENIKLLKFQKNPYKYLSKCDVFILSSIYEGLPNVLLEALALKKIIISSNCPTGPKEILSFGKGGVLFKMKNYKELAKKIIFIKKNPHLIKRKINYGYKSLNRFDYNKNLEKYLHVVKKILKVQ